MARAFMQSLLLDYLQKLGERFIDQYDHPWLIWEANAWSAPSLDGQTRIGGVPSVVAPARSAQALCFGLSFKGQAKQITLGRANGNDIVINDGTVSRQHLVLTRNVFGTWHVRTVAGSSGTVCADRPLVDGDIAPIVDRQKLKVGAVDLTFYEAQSLVDRLRALAAGRNP